MLHTPLNSRPSLLLLYQDRTEGRLAMSQACTTGCTVNAIEPEALRALCGPHFRQHRRGVEAGVPACCVRCSPPPAAARGKALPAATVQLPPQPPRASVQQPNALLCTATHVNVILITCIRKCPGRACPPSGPWTRPAGSGCACQRSPWGTRGRPGWRRAPSRQQADSSSNSGAASLR